MYKKIISFIITIMLCTSLTGIVNADTTSFTKNMYPQAELPVAQIETQLAKADKLYAENDKVALYLDEKALNLKVVDKVTGYIWSSSPAVKHFEGMSIELQRFAQSILTCEVITPAGNLKRSPLKHASAKSPQIKKLDNGKGFEATVNFYEANLTLTFIVELLEDGLSFSVPDDKIVYPKKEADKNLINKLYIMPFFGAEYKNEMPGYMFVPDGSGALIRFNEPRPYTSTFSAKVYGDDLGIKKFISLEKSDLPPAPEQQKIYMPVFGIAHGTNNSAFLAHLTTGAEFAEIEASPAGAIIDYNWQAAKFAYKELYYQPTGRTTGFNAVSPNENAVNPKIEYHILSNENANYVGMAKKYQEILKNNGTLVSKIDTKKDIPIKLDAVMAEQAKSVVGKSIRVMTTVSNATTWVDELAKSNMSNVLLSLVGSEKGGISGHDIGSYSLESKVGSKADIKKLSESLTKNGGDLVIQSDIIKGFKHQLPSSSVIYACDGGVITINDWRPLYHEVRFKDIDAISKSIKNILKLGTEPKNFAFDSFGYLLYSDYQRGNAKYRDQILKETNEALLAAQDATNLLLLESPNSYAFKYADKAYDVPMANSQYMFEDEVVPFYQIVLSGHVDMFSSYLNYKLNSKEDLLQLIDFNIYPSFVLTEQYTNKFTNTNTTDIYTSRFADWKPYIAEYYDYLNGILKQVKGQQIVSRNIVSDGVSVVGYSNGIEIAINYNDTPYTYKNVVVDKKSASVIGGANNGN